MNNKVIKIVISFTLIVFSVSAYDDNDTKSISSFNLPGQVTGASISDVTKIIAAKEVSPSGNKNSPDIKLTITMPPRPAKLDIVLAMDTSGSMVQNYIDDGSGKTQIEWASDAIGSMIEKYPEARVSIVSWDDEDVIGDIETRFYDVSTENDSIMEELKKLPLECKETDHTIYSFGVKRAVQVLDKYPPIDPYNTARIIIFVTGLSEFMAEPKNASNEITLDYQLQNARRNRDYGSDASFDGYQIFPVQIGIDPIRFKWEYNNLSKMITATKIRNEPLRDYPYSKDDINDLGEAIDEILNGLRSRPIAQDVEVIDTLYPYLEYLGSENSRKIPVNKTTNSADGSTTLHWNIGKMNSSDEWWALIHARLMLRLPIEVSDNETEVIYRIADTTPISEVRYTWLTGFKGILPFPEGEIKFGGDAAFLQ